MTSRPPYGGLFLVESVPAKACSTLPVRNNRSLGMHALASAALAVPLAWMAHAVLRHLHLI